MKIEQYIKHKPNGERYPSPFGNDPNENWAVEGWFELKKTNRKMLIAKLLMLGVSYNETHIDGAEVWDTQLAIPDGPVVLCIHKDGRADLNVDRVEVFIREVIATRE